MNIRRPTPRSQQAKHRRRLGHLWTFFLPVYLIVAAALDPGEVTNREYLQFVIATRNPPPEHWANGRYPAGRENDPVVLVNFHEAAAYCRFVCRRLPSVHEWKSICEGGKLQKHGDIWEWTSTDVDMGGQTYKALCGPGNSCDCSHRYLPEWKNEVKGFRCVQDSMPVVADFVSGRSVFVGNTRIERLSSQPHCQAGYQTIVEQSSRS